FFWECYLVAGSAHFWLFATVPFMRVTGRVLRFSALLHFRIKSLLGRLCGCVGCSSALSRQFLSRLRCSRLGLRGASARSAPRRNTCLSRLSGGPGPLAAQSRADGVADWVFARVSRRAPGTRPCAT